MSNQPRQRAGTRQSAVSVGGRFVSKDAPTIKNDVVGFHTAPVGPPCDWTTRTVNLWGTSTTFRRTAKTSDEGNEVVTVTVDCDPPDMMLLARKGDTRYWSANNWSQHYEDRQLWSVDITRRMLEEGFVATDKSWGSIKKLTGSGGVGIHTAMTAVSDPHEQVWRNSPHVLTGVVAQLRGLRLIQSMAPDQSNASTLGGYRIPETTGVLVGDRYDDVLAVYNRLPQPPWEDGVAWGPQPIAGHATTINGHDVFVGEKSDLLWRALTETDHGVPSPLQHAVMWRVNEGQGMFTAAALYDETAEHQLTHGLLDDVHPLQQHQKRTAALDVFNAALNPPLDKNWTSEQQQRIAGFIKTIETLNP